MMPKLLGKTTLEERADVEPLVRRLIKAAVAGRDSRRHPAHDVASGFDAMSSRQLAVPTLIIVGDEDVLTPSDDARKMAAANPKAELVVLPRAGHLANLEQPQLFNDALRAFLSRL